MKVLLCPVNLVFPQDVFESGRGIDALFDELGKEIIAVHTKDLFAYPGSETLMQIEETVPGHGVLDQRTLPRRARELPVNVTLHVEHFERPDVIDGQDHLRSVAKELRLSIG